MKIFDPERNSVREQTRRKAHANPPPLPATAAGVLLAHRLVPRYTRAERAASFLFTGKASLIFAAVIVGAIAWLTDFNRVSGSCALMALTGGAAVIAVAGIAMIIYGARLRAVAHIPAPHLELDDVDLRPGVPFQLAFVQERGARLENVLVSLVCDETVIEREETPLIHHDAAAGTHTRGVYRNASGDWVQESRTPVTSRIVDQTLIDLPLVDASHRRFEMVIDFHIPPGAPPTGETTDHKVAWSLSVDGALQDGVSISERYAVRVRDARGGDFRVGVADG